MGGSATSIRRQLTPGGGWSKTGAYGGTAYGDAHYGGAYYHPPACAYYPVYHPPTTVNYYGAGCYNCGGWSTAGAAAAGAAVGLVAGAAVASANTAAVTSSAYNAGVAAGAASSRHVCDGSDLSHAACRLHYTDRPGHDILSVRQYLVSSHPTARMVSTIALCLRPDADQRSCDTAQRQIDSVTA